MDYKARINAIRRRAERISAPLRDLCAAADLNISTFHRWQQEDANPRLRSMSRALDAMEAELQRREDRLVAEISGGRDGPPAATCANWFDGRCETCGAADRGYEVAATHPCRFHRERREAA
jgi:hypothetical protein